MLIVMASSCWQLASSRTKRSVAVGSKLCQGNTMKCLITVGIHTAVRSSVGDTLQQPVSQQLMMNEKVIRLPRSFFSPPSCLRPHHMWKNYGHTLVPVSWGSRSALVEARCHKGGAPGEVRPRPDRILLGSKGSILIGDSGGLRRTFGGQSVVPWELALFLVEEMKGEGVEPGAVVYTAALAECRWAGEQEHVRYLNREMDARGLKIVKGIPGAVDNDPPPSQSPPLHGKFPTLPPGYSGDISDVKSNGGNFLQVATATKTADTALATIEAMWARGKHDPSPATCRAALDACASGGQWERALSLVRDSAMEMAAHTEGVGIESRQVPEELDLPARVERLALEGRWNEALSMVQEAAE